MIPLIIYFPLLFVGYFVIDLFLLEIKMNKSAQSAMQQINLKNYPNRFALSGKPITKVAINFDSNKGNIENWMIEKA